MDALRTDRSANTSLLVARLLVFVVLGYWAFGKAFAYLGLYPLYIGEVVLAAGLLYLIHRGTIPVPNQALFWLYSVFLLVVLGQASYSVLVLGQPPLEVVRNLAVVYYGLFAIITFVLITRFAGSNLYRDVLERWLPRAAPWLLLGGTISVIGGIFLASSLPKFPLTDSVSVLYYKPTDAVMPLVVLLALWLRGYLTTRWMIWTAGLLAIAAGRSRSAMLAVGVAVLAMVWRPTKRMLQMMAIGALLFIFLLVTDIRVDLGYREVSARQFLANISSVIGSDEAASGLDATTTRNKDWRAAWWDAIYNDAVDNARIVVGLGWGVNLADHFGFQTEASDVNALRNPHNALLGILARGGWLAASLWVAFYLFLLYGLWQATRKFAGDRYRQDMAWAVMLYVLASQINGATDVFLESPQNAIPHWIVVGIGWALIRDAQALALPDPGKPPRVLPVPDPPVGSGAGIGRPRTPALAVQLAKARPCPSLALDGDRGTCGMAPRSDHVCLKLDGAPVGTAWQEHYCLGAHRACPHFASEAASAQPRADARGATA